MLLKIQRSQRKGMLGKTIFALDIRADYAAEEKTNINKYNLGGEIVYSSEAANRHRASMGDGHLGNAVMHAFLASLKLNITVASLQRGHHVECKNMEELLGAEDAVRAAAKNLTSWLDAATTFDGREMVIEYAGGEEKPHPTGTPIVG